MIQIGILELAEALRCPRTDPQGFLGHLLVVEEVEELLGFVGF